MNKPKAIFIDIDGVMTNGKKTYDAMGEVVSKEFCDQDFTAIKRIEKEGIPIFLISGDDRVNKRMCIKRGIIDFKVSTSVIKKVILTLLLYFKDNK